MAEEKRNRTVEIKAEPDPVTIDLLRTAVIVVDMQNAFVKKGGYFDLAGYDLTGVERIVEPCRKVAAAARESGARVIYLQMGFSRDLSDKGPPDSPVNAKSKGLRFISNHPDLKDKFYFYGCWGAEIIPELSPRQGDIVVPKQRYDAFIGTNLDIILRTHGVKNLVFVGTATNVCVESTLRHAFFLDYFPILVSDAVVQAGSDVTQQATILNVKSHFGWVTTSENFERGVESFRTE
ncbi:MAG: isochorismatase family protein [Desulfobacteraceae bacterium]|nr:MAG: isochorismatase family protein [Desulfobacteraceae bacterium]